MMRQAPMLRRSSHRICGCAVRRALGALATDAARLAGRRHNDVF